MTTFALSKPFAFLVLTSALISGTAAKADPLLFTLTGPYSATWQMDSAPAPDYYSLIGDFQDFWLRVFGDFGSSTPSVAQVEFRGSPGQSNQLLITTGPNLNELPVIVNGPMLYVGPSYAPVFQLGSYALNNAPGLIGHPGDYVLTISAVPEPGTAAMLLAGVVGLTFVRKARRHY